MPLIILNIVVALLVGFGAVQELIIRGIRDGELQPALLSLAGIVVSVLFAISAVAMIQKWPNTRRLVAITATLSIVVHVYGAMPPHRNVGPVALIVGAGYGLVLLIITLNSKENRVAAT
jgi:hypothetical protein